MLLRFQSQRSLARWVDPKRAELLQVEHLRRVTDHEDRDTARANDGGGAEVPRLPTTHRPVTDVGSIEKPDQGALMFAASSSRHRRSLLVLQAFQHGRHWAKQEARS